MTLKKSDGTDVTEKELRQISYVREHSSPEYARGVIRATLQGAAYCWCATRGHDEFALRDLFGGVNANWYGTPLQEIYHHYLYWYIPKFEVEGRENAEAEAESEAHDKAGEDVGWMLKETLFHDNRAFVLTKNNPNHYIWESQDS